MNWAVFVDEDEKSGRLSTFWAVFVDKDEKSGRLSTNWAVFVDGKSQNIWI